MSIVTHALHLRVEVGEIAEEWHNRFCSRQTSEAASTHEPETVVKHAHLLVLLAHTHASSFRIFIIIAAACCVCCLSSCSLGADQQRISRIQWQQLVEACTGCLIGLLALDSNVSSAPLTLQDNVSDRLVVASSWDHRRID